MCKAHRLVYHSTLGSRVIKKKKVSGLEHLGVAQLVVKLASWLKVWGSGFRRQG